MVHEPPVGPFLFITGNRAEKEWWRLQDVFLWYLGPPSYVILLSYQSATTTCVRVKETDQDGGQYEIRSEVSALPKAKSYSTVCSPPAN